MALIYPLGSLERDAKTQGYNLIEGSKVEALDARLRQPDACRPWLGSCTCRGRGFQVAVSPCNVVYGRGEQSDTAQFVTNP